MEQFDFDQVVQRPDPPAWLITDSEAVETEDGFLRQGKEAVATLVTRRLGSRVNSFVLKSYSGVWARTKRYRSFYMEEPGSRNPVRQHKFAGRASDDSLWARREFTALRTLWRAGLRVPYPVSYLGDSLLLELITEKGAPAPRLIDTDPPAAALADLLKGAMEFVAAMLRCGIVHSDLSAYNLLYADQKLWVIDLPQWVDFNKHPMAVELLMRDVANVSRYFLKKGLEVDVAREMESILTGTISCYGSRRNNPPGLERAT